MNEIEATALTAYHLVVSEISKVPISEISALAQKIPALVAEAETLTIKVADDVEVAATWLQKQEAVVTPLLAFVPEPYQTEARGVLVMLVSAEVMAQKIAAEVKEVVGNAQTHAAPLPAGTTSQH